MEQSNCEKLGRAFPSNQDYSIIYSPEYLFLGIALSSSFDDTHGLVMLSWDPLSYITSGVIAYEDSKWSSDFLSYVRRLGSQARLPMAPVCLLLYTWADVAKARNRFGWLLVNTVAVALGYIRGNNENFGFSEEQVPTDYTMAHKNLVQATGEFTSVHHNFLYSTTDALLLLFQDWPQWPLWQNGQIPTTAMWELDVQFIQFRDSVRAIKSEADGYMMRIDLQMKVLYNLMQQGESKNARSIALDSKKLAEASTRDSSSMKAIAVLTMVFLPSTTIATIFSMGPFWSNESGSTFSVSSEFWLYWAVTLPLTAVVMVVWQTWLWLYRRRRDRKLKELEDGAEEKELVDAAEKKDN
ncbi:MAG: hypothetical protein Q9178_007479 [Gyalolechia marmorata]